MHIATLELIILNRLRWHFEHSLRRTLQQNFTAIVQENLRCLHLIDHATDNKKHECNYLYITYLIQHPVELIPCLNNTISVIAINDKDKTLCVLEVVPPQWSDL